MMRPSRILAMLLLAWVVGSASPAAAETFKVTTLDRDNDVLTEPLKWWMRTIAERTAQRVHLEPFWAESLVPLARTMSAVQSGIADVGWFVTPILSGQEKDFSILTVPGSIPADGARFLQAWQAIKPVMGSILDRHGVVMLWPRPSPKVPLACKSKFLTQASDYAGVKVRAAGQWQIAAVTRWGASAFPIAPAETYTALQRGTVDCTYHIYPVLWSLKLYEVAPYITRIDFAGGFTFMGMNREKWNRLAEADRQVIEEASREATRREIETLKQREEGLIEDMKKAGAKVHVPAAAERKRLSDAVKPLWQEVRKVMGPDGQKLADLLEPFETQR